MKQCSPQSAYGRLTISQLRATYGKQVLKLPAVHAAAADVVALTHLPASRAC